MTEADLEFDIEFARQIVASKQQELNAWRRRYEELVRQRDAQPK